MSSEKTSLIVTMASKFGVDPTLFFETLKATAFKQRDGSAPTNEQMMALMVVANQYDLNPFTREIYAFPDKFNGIVPVVGVDGWSRIVNDHPAFDGVDFEYSEKRVAIKGTQISCHEWIESVIHRKDRLHPIRVREHLDECYRTINGPWQTHPKRMLRHKALIQGARIAFGFSGIYDQDEAERIGDVVESPAVVVQSEKSELTPSQSATMLLSETELNPLLEQLALRAKNSNAWSAAHEYAQTRFSGENLEFATEFLNKKEEEQFKNSAQASLAVHQPEERSPILEMDSSSVDDDQSDFFH